jgi:hypothetical protein
MAYIIERKTRFYVVTYDGTDPATGREGHGGTSEEHPEEGRVIRRKAPPNDEGPGR